MTKAVAICHLYWGQNCSCTCENYLWVLSLLCMVTFCSHMDSFCLIFGAIFPPQPSLQFTVFLVLYPQQQNPTPLLIGSFLELYTHQVILRNTYPSPFNLPTLSIQPHYFPLLAPSIFTLPCVVGEEPTPSCHPPPLSSPLYSLDFVPRDGPVPIHVETSESVKYFRILISHVVIKRDVVQKPLQTDPLTCKIKGMCHI